MSVRRPRCARVSRPRTATDRRSPAAAEPGPNPQSPSSKAQSLPMNAFEYAAPRSEAEVLELLMPQRGPTEILAGGTDLVPLMKKRLATPDRVVNIMEVAEFRGIRD